jgi:hypothetical protein
MTKKVDMEKIDAVAKLVNQIYQGSEVITNSDAVFVHGWGDLHDEMIGLTAKIFKESGAKLILLNGASEYELGSPGFKYWKQELTRKFGIPVELISETKPAENTLIEALALAEFVRKQKISRLIVLSVPQHIVRAFLTDLGVMNEARLTASLNPKTITNASWLEPITIRNLSGSDEHTTRLGRIAAEFARVNEYRARFESGDKGFTIASIEEALKHLQIL